MVVRAATVDDVPGIARVHVASWEDTYRGILDDRIIDAQTYAVRVAFWSGALADTHRLIRVAHDEDRGIAGFASAVFNRPELDAFDSYLQHLYLLPTAKGSGIGRLLLQNIAAALSLDGRTTMALRVARRNPARRFYERLGARLTTAPLAIDDGFFDDVVYAFDELRLLK